MSISTLKTTINSAQLYNSTDYGFSHAVQQHKGQTIHLAGQVAWDKDYQLVGGDSITGQAKQVLLNIKQVLAEVGAGPENLVRLRTYLVNHTTEDMMGLSKMITEFYEGHLPAANTMLGVTQLALPEFRIEIEGIAVIPTKD